MTFALWCVFAAMWLPLFLAITAKWGFRNFDNSRPREWLASQEGFRQRAVWAQSNAWEAFAPFAAAVLIAHYLGAGQATVDWLAGVFIVARALHGLFYVIDRPTARSVAWLAGMIAVISLFVVAAAAG